MSGWRADGRADGRAGERTRDPGAPGMPAWPDCGRRPQAPSGRGAAVGEAEARGAEAGEGHGCVFPECLPHPRPEEGGCRRREVFPQRSRAARWPDAPARPPGVPSPRCVQSADLCFT